MAASSAMLCSSSGGQLSQARGGQRELLPHHQPELVAQVVEPLPFQELAGVDAEEVQSEVVVLGGGRCS